MLLSFQVERLMREHPGHNFAIAETWADAKPGYFLHCRDCGKAEGKSVPVTGPSFVERSDFARFLGALIERIEAEIGSTEKLEAAVVPILHDASPYCARKGLCGTDECECNAKVN